MAALSDVVATGTANDVRMLLKSGAYVNCRDRQGRTPLQTALLRGDAAIVEALLIEGASIMFTGDAGTTLRFTASNQNRCILASLRAMAAFPNMSALCLPARNVSRETALAVAGAGKIDALSAFLLSISPFDATSLVEALRQALAFQQYDAVRILLCCWRRGVMNPSDGRTPLHVAASAGYLEVLFALMMVGENSNARDHAGQTALHVAVAAGQIHIAGTLVRMGASLVARDYRARTPIQLAIRAKNAEMVEALFQQTRAWSRVQNEADNLVAELTEAVDGGNSSVVAAVYRGLVSNECINDLLVDQAVHRGRGDIVSVALNSRALANSKNENGRTPLHFAAATGRCDLAQVLLQGGAAVDEPGGIDGTTALHLASAEGHGDVVELLLGSGASVCAADNVGSTPLLYAALKRKSTFSKRVRQPEVAVDFPDSETISSLRVAVVRDFARVVGTLTAYGASTSGALCAAIHNDDDVTLCALLKSGTWSLVRLTGVCALLQMATKAKSLRAMKVLLAFGAGSNVKDTTSRTTPLHVGAENWFGNGVRLLLCAKANPRALDTRGCSALMVAACRGHCYVVQLLLKAGANPDVADADGNTALHMAARHGHGGTIAVLVRNAQVDVNVLNTKQESALYFALEVGDRESVISLLGAGASVTTGFCSYGSAVYLAAHRGLDGFLLGMRDFGISADLEGEGVISPLLHAAHCQDDAAVLTLLQHHASVSRVYGGGDTIMHRTTDPRSMTWLMKLDAPVNGCNTRNFTPLHCAAIGGRAAVLEVLLSDRKAWDDIDAKTDENMTALMYAVDGWHNASVEVLVSSGASVRVPTYNGRTALHLAVEKDFVHAVKTIVDGDTFAIHIEDNDGVCPLHMALEDSHLDALRFLLMDPAGIIRRDHPSQLRGCTALHLAVWEGRIEAVKQLLQRTDSVNSFNCERQTPLHFASAYSNVEVVRMLLAGGAFLGARDSQRATPLHVAVFFDRHDIALVLLRAGAPVGEENIDGNTALHIACSGGGRFALSMACALLGHGAPTTCRNVDGLTPLHLAVQSSRADIALAVLEERGGQLSAISHPDEDMGHTPLHSAVQANAGDMVAILLKFGAPVNKQNIEGASPLYVACEEGYFAIAQRLLRSEASPGTGGRGGMTPLHAVCLNGHTNLVRLLLERGALPGHCMNAEGTSPLHVAVEGKYLRVVKTLLPRLAASHINRHSKNGETPLIMGVRQQDEKVVDAVSVTQSRAAIARAPMACSRRPFSCRLNSLSSLRKMLRA